MPYLRFEISVPVAAQEREDFARWVARQYAQVMETGTEHISVAIHVCETAALFIGRVGNPAEGVAIITADIRAGRQPEQRRRLAVSIMDEIHRRWRIPARNMYLVFTEHPGEDFNLYEHALSSWSAGEAPFR